jgi:hypothetical protein
MSRPHSPAPLRAAAAVLLCCLLGCTQDRIRKALPPDVRVDTWTQQSASRIDVLWVVDNSGSMEPRQSNLARNFGSFIDVFTTNAIDYRLAITTTDTFKDKGAFKGSPSVITPKTPSPVAAFQSNIRVGTAGSPYEAGMEAAVMALDARAALNTPILEALETCRTGCLKKSDVSTCQANCANAHAVEFLRPDAYLYVVFVTDEEDKSSNPDLRYYYRKLETALGPGNDGMVSTAAIIGDVPSNTCNATPGSRYAQLVELAGGELGSICDPEFATTLRKLATSAVGLKRKFALAKAPNVSTLEVRILYPCSTPADTTAACAKVDRANCTADVPVDSYNLVCTPKQGGPDGWAYEPNGRLVYFAGESVPGVNAKLEVQYYEEGKP